MLSIAWAIIGIIPGFLWWRLQAAMPMPAPIKQDEAGGTSDRLDREGHGPR